MASSGAPSSQPTSSSVKHSNNLISRFTHLLRPIRSTSSISASSANKIDVGANGITEKPLAYGSLDDTPSSGPLDSSAGRGVKGRYEHDLGENKDRRRYARTLPPWVHSYDKNDINNDPEQSASLIPQSPQTARQPQHNHTPVPKQNAVRGRAFDHARKAEPVTPSRVTLERTSQWQSFAQSSSYGYSQREEGHIVDEDWVRENAPDLSEPWNPGNLYPEVEKDGRLWLFSGEKRSATGEHIQRILMRNPFIPLIVRVFVLTMTTTALGLGAWIYHTSNVLNTNPADTSGVINGSGSEADQAVCQQQASTYMAFIVDSFAVIYLVYITWDEYFSKPLGLRSSKDKMRLLFLDLLFIVFSAANLSLAFETLTDQQWSCYRGNPEVSNDNNLAAATTTCIYNKSLCHRQGALCGVLLVAEVAWVMTFTISVLRVVERLSR